MVSGQKGLPEPEPGSWSLMVCHAETMSPGGQLGGDRARAGTSASSWPQDCCHRCSLLLDVNRHQNSVASPVDRVTEFTQVPYP